MYGQTVRARQESSKIPPQASRPRDRKKLLTPYIHYGCVMMNGLFSIERREKAPLHVDIHGREAIVIVNTQYGRIEVPIFCIYYYLFEIGSAFILL